MFLGRNIFILEIFFRNGINFRFFCMLKFFMYGLMVGRMRNFLVLIKILIFFVIFLFLNVYVGWVWLRKIFWNFFFGNFVWLWRKSFWLRINFLIMEMFLNFLVIFLILLLWLFLVIMILVFFSGEKNFRSIFLSLKFRFRGFLRFFRIMRRLGLFFSMNWVRIFLKLVLMWSFFESLKLMWGLVKMRFFLWEVLSLRERSWSLEKRDIELLEC